jgi:hypothetical protein
MWRKPILFFESSHASASPTHQLEMSRRKGVSAQGIISGAAQRVSRLRELFPHFSLRLWAIVGPIWTCRRWEKSEKKSIDGPSGSLTLSRISQIPAE